MNIRIKKLQQEAIMPTYGSAFSAGADLYVCEPEAITIPAGKTALLHTGLAFELPEGYVGLIFARSSLGTKRGLAPANKVGVIDADYRGEVMISLHNHSAADQVIEPKERVAQMVIVPFLKAQFEIAENLSDTVRGNGGFGSTGTK